LKKKGTERKEGKGRWRGHFGVGMGRQKGDGRKGRNEEKKKRGGAESWNRAAEWLRPALKCAHISDSPGSLKGLCRF